MMRGEREGSTENEVELYMMMCVRREHFYSVHVHATTNYAERALDGEEDGVFGSNGDVSPSLSLLIGVCGFDERSYFSFSPLHIARCFVSLGLLLFWMI